MSVAGVNDATKRWKEWCDNVQAQTTVNRAESEADVMHASNGHGRIMPFS